MAHVEEGRDGGGDDVGVYWLSACVLAGADNYSTGEGGDGANADGVDKEGDAGGCDAGGGFWGGKGGEEGGVNGTQDGGSAGVGLVDLFLGLVGEEWSGEKKGRIREVTEGVLRSEGERFLVREGARIGVSMVAWIAVARK